MESDKKILVIEDDVDIGGILVDVFTDVGYDAVWVESASEALEYLKNDGFDLVTLDLRLPDMSGNDLLRELSLRAFFYPVVVISASLENLKPHPLIRATLSKPFDVKKLLSIVEQNV